MVNLKRSREEEGAELLLSLSWDFKPQPATAIIPNKKARGVFQCKTCSRQFPTFQALGGHRTSHLRPRTADRSSASKPTTHHRCSICGAEFALGQALGGHMRRHKVMEGGGHGDSTKQSSSTTRDLKRLDLNLTNSMEFGNPGDLFRLPRSSSHLQLLQLFV